MKPTRGVGESLDDWLDRKAEWEASPDGLAEAAAKESEDAKDRAWAQRRHWEQDVGMPLRAIEVILGGVRENLFVGAVGDERKRLLVLSGGFGSGKTVAACLAASREHGSLFVRASALARWDRYDNAEMYRLLSARLLVIDDLGTEFADVNGNFMAILDEVVIDRSENLRRTVITTNLNVDQFRERYQGRVADRIREFGAFVESPDPSMRGVAR